MDGLSVNVDDLGRLITTLDVHVEAVSDRAVLATRKSTLDMERIAKSIVAVDTGALKNSIHIEESSSFGSFASSVIADTNYAVFVERGTSRMAPQPYMAPARAAVEPGWVAAMAQCTNPFGPVGVPA